MKKLLQYLAIIAIASVITLGLNRCTTPTDSVSLTQQLDTTNIQVIEKTNISLYLDVRIVKVYDDTLYIVTNSYDGVSVIKK